ncbi:MAG: hypothetical protein JWO38_4414 [Gemmataceae bacterium]|nr:hypothetical protein [Gemmataceae bacterium]
MENPVRFDIWTVVRPGAAAEAFADSLLLNRNLPEPEARRQVSRSSREGAFVRLAGGVPWSHVLRVRDAPPAWTGELRCYQEGYSPADPPAGYCPEHDLYFGGCLGCHVCTGFFVR